MLKQPKISVITPVYNGLPYIKECVESVLSQDFQEWEMLISDNCSTDGTQEYLNTIVDSRIRIFKQEKNLGIYGNLNFLFSKANAPISQILCADDYFIDKKSLKTVVNYWSLNNNDIGFVRFNHNEKASCKLTAFQKEYLNEIILPQKADLIFYLFGNISGNLSNVTLKTEIVQKLEWFREDLPYAGDFEFWSRAARVYGMGLEKQMIVYVRRHERVASNYLNQHGELISQNLIIISSLYDRIKTREAVPSFWLKLHATINYDSLQRDIAIKQFFKGNKRYLTELTKSLANNRYILNGLVWPLYLISFGGRLFRVQTAKRILIKNK